jgi:uncharacterized membrane protein YecN with MAPEG domain
MTLPVSFTFIALCAGALFPTVGWIGLLRGRIGVLRGDGGNPTLFKRIRIHANFIETAPLTAMVLLAAESLGLAQGWLWAALLSYFLGRVGHYVLYDSKLRAGPMALTVGPGLLLGLWTLWTLWA